LSPWAAGLNRREEVGIVTLGSRQKKEKKFSLLRPTEMYSEDLFQAKGSKIQIFKGPLPRDRSVRVSTGRVGL